MLCLQRNQVMPHQCQVIVVDSQAGAGQQAPASSLLQTDAVPLGQTGGSGSLHSESGDTAQDRLRGSGTSCDPSSEERRRDEASRDSLSEQNEARSDPKVSQLLC